MHLSLFLLLFALAANSKEENKTMNVKRITPVLFVKEIEPILPFWVDALGFAKTIEVHNLDAVLTALKNSKIVQPERTAFYGMREVGYQDPAGHFITFAQPVAAGQNH